MRVVSIHLENFGSYKVLDFDFQNQGLTLIQGATGSGKSTLMDAIPWILFGITAKGGKADEVCSWSKEGPTMGTIMLSNGTVITRRRNPNDLIYNEIHRGKDLSDTQRLINQLLKVDADLYLSGAYYHEFSQTAQFFTTSAKNRRQICEQIVDLSLAKTLQEKTKYKAKELQNKIYELQQRSKMLKSNIELLQQHETAEKKKAKAWEKEQASTLVHVHNLYDRFEAGRKKIITNECRACGTVLARPKEVYDDSPNPYADRISELKQTVNPHTDGVKDFRQEISDKNKEMAAYTYEAYDKSLELRDLELLQEIVETFRGELIENTIQHVERQTNETLMKYFDAEIQVAFSAEAADKLEVSITKDGNVASYTQLSKGQRQLLKLSFATAVMSAVQNHSGVIFNQIFMDEALDGLDENMKTKAYRFIDNLASIYESVFVVEHSEGLKALFPNSYKVTLVNGESQIAVA